MGDLMQRARVEERERCARLAEGQAEFVAGESHERLCHHIAKLIRERDGRARDIRPEPLGFDPKMILR